LPCSPLPFRRVDIGGVFPRGGQCVAVSGVAAGAKPTIIALDRRRMVGAQSCQLIYPATVPQQGSDMIAV
jgi:hypothetical protein